MRDYERRAHNGHTNHPTPTYKNDTSLQQNEQSWFRVSEMNLKQEWVNNRRQLVKTGARIREEEPTTYTIRTLTNLANLNRVTCRKTTRSGIHKIIEATSGIGGTPEHTTRTQHQHQEDWFAPFVKGYSGRNPVFICKVEGTKIRALLDTGAQVHIIGNKTLEHLVGDYSPLLRSSRTKATDVKGRPVPILGTTQLQVAIKGSIRTLNFEVIEGADTLIIGNQLLYDEDLIVVARDGFGTRAEFKSSLHRRGTTKLRAYATQDELITKGDVKKVKVAVKGKRREWANQINRSFLIDGDSWEDMKLHPTISHLNEEGELIAIISNESGTQDVTIEKGTFITWATTDYTDGEEKVTEAMAELATIQDEIRHISADDIVRGDADLQNKDMEISPPGFQLDGPQPGGVAQNGKYDYQRENEGSSIETAHIHIEDRKHKDQIRNLLKENKSMFSRHNYDIGHFAIDGVVQKVRLKVSDTTPIVEKYRTISPAKRETAEAILQELENAKIISRKASGFASQAVWVQKALPELTPERAKELNIEFVPGAKDPTGKRNLRFCQDFRQLNARLETVQWPLPAVKQVLARLGKTKYVSVLDASHSFYCIELCEESKIYTGFQALERNYVMNRLAMGLSCSSGILNACLAQSLQGLEHCVVPYSDNILVLSDSAEQHVQDLRRVLKALREHGWVFKLAKCHWAVHETLKVFGMEVNLKAKTIAPDQDKLKAIRKTPLPRKKKQLRSFLGSLGYFVECLPDIGKPLAELNDLTKTAGENKGEDIKWCPEKEQAFQDIMKILSETHHLFMPDWNQPMHLVTDAGPKHTSAMLLQIKEEKWVPLGFFTKKLSTTEQKLSQIEKEALAVIYGLKQANYYCSHSKTFIHSDNKPFVLLRKYASQNTKLSRYKMYIDSYDHVLVWNKSTEPAITMVDFLSRPPCKKLMNKQISKEDIEKIPTNVPNGIFTPDQYNHIIDEIINKEETKGETKQGPAAINNAIAQATSPTEKEIAQTELANEIRRVSTRQQTRLGKPSAKNTTPTEKTTEGEALLELVMNDCPHLNMKDLAKLQKDCSQLGPIYKNIEKYPEYEMCNEILLKRFTFKEIKRILLCVPVILADDLLGDLHRGITTNHAGERKLRNLVRTRYFVPQLRKRVRKITQNCGICGYYKPRNKGGPRPDTKKITPRHPSDIWAMDIVQVTSKPDHNDHNALICFTDLYSHYLICKPIKKDITARQAADIFLQEVIARFGVPRALLSDNASNMDNELWREMANLLCIAKFTISPGSPKSNGIVEKVQGLIVNAIKYQAAQYRIKPQDWASLAIWACLAHNATPFDNMEPPLSPAEIFLGRSIAESSFFGFANAAYAYKNLEEFNRNMVAAQMTIAEILDSKRRYLEELENKKKILTAPHWDFPSGTLVALKDKTQPRVDTHIKLRPKYRGVFIVIRQTTTSCLIRPFSSESILEDMEDELVAHKGRGRPLPRYKIIKADKNDLKKLTQLVFYSAPMAKKFVEHLKSEAPIQGQTFSVENDNMEDDMLTKETSHSPEPEETIYDTKRKREDGTIGPPAKIARVNTFDFTF